MTNYRKSLSRNVVKESIEGALEIPHIVNFLSSFLKQLKTVAIYTAAIITVTTERKPSTIGTEGTKMVATFFKQ